MPLSNSNARALLATTLAAALLAASGCSMFHHKNGGGLFHNRNVDYSKSSENRPLEVPPDLDTPATDPAMQIPVTHGAAAGAGDAVVTDSSNPSFTLTDNVAGSWDRLGRALERIDGVTITQRAQALGTYEVQYKGATMLLRAASEGDATRIDAVGPAGKSFRTPEAIELLNLLRDRMG